MRQSDFARKVLEALDAAKWSITAVDLDDYTGDAGTITVEQALTLLNEVAALTVYVRNGARESFVWFVWQGSDATYAEGEEILVDYGTKLSPVLEPLFTEV